MQQISLFLLDKTLTFKHAACHERSGDTLSINWSWIGPPQPTQRGGRVPMPEKNIKI